MVSSLEFLDTFNSSSIPLIKLPIASAAISFYP